MTEFEKQLNQNIKSALKEFNDSEDLKNVRNTYKLHFDKIAELLSSRNQRIVVEDIINFDKNNNSIIMVNFNLITEINRGIKESKISSSDIT